MGLDVGRSLIATLGQDCATGAALAERLEQGVQSITAASLVGRFSAASVERVARNFESRGWLVKDGSAWRLTQMAIPKGLASFLAGAAEMRVQALSETASVAVVTLPGAPSRLTQVLPIEGPVHASMEATDNEITRIAKSAVTSITIMSPFVNREGADFAMRVFDQSQAKDKTLITRLAGKTGHVVRPLLTEMGQRGIRVLDYFIPAGEGYETFHAKVVIADGDLAYVGSANMTMYNRHSMELGIIVKGKAAHAVAALVRSVQRISIPAGMP
ncbi:phospholipase D-like domain-containing protein [Devosia chinhatensis]|uniref:phospholipase D-like domain-containing protein n=1 Tax=Devosia chinhatensis TaxID=429727 RepID=UPI00136499B0|nr:phospholipase D-like domain-containing protein [Devosia chinhatensis]